MINKSVLKQVGIVLAALIVVAAVILLLTLVINGPNRILTSEELALEQTRIAQEIVLKQTEVAKTSAAGLYLTLGVPFPTETPFVIPTGGALGRDTRTPSAVDASGGYGMVTAPVQRTQAARTGTLTAGQQTQARTATLAPGQPTLTNTATVPPEATDIQPVGWEGEWTVYFGADWEELTIGSVNVTVSGSSFNSVGEIPGGGMTLTGEITADGQQVYGQYTTQEKSGNFFWEMTEGGQFGGNMDGNFRFCGAREGLPQPEVCGIYFLE